MSRGLYLVMRKIQKLNNLCNKYRLNHNSASKMKDTEYSCTVLLKLWSNSNFYRRLMELEAGSVIWGMYLVI